MYYGVESGVYTNVIDVGNTTNVTISGLVEGVTYYFAATAYNSLGMESIFSNEAVYTVPLPNVNQPPTLDPISDVTINENSGAQTVALSGITSGATNEIQPLTVTAISSNPALIPNPTVNYTSPNTTGSLTFTPVVDGYGTATITVTVNDGSTNNNTFSRTFTVTVIAVNQQPTLNPISNVTINEDAGQQTVNLSGITSGAANENQTLTVTATSSNAGLIPNPTVNYTSPNTTGTLTFAPVANANGSATITVTVNDGGTGNNVISRSFTVTVSPVNDPPTLDPIGNITINENAGQQTVSLSGITSGATNEIQTLSVTAASSNPGLVPTPTVQYTSPNSTGTLRFTPATNAYGSATITVTVNDGQAQNNTFARTFTVTVDSPPTITSVANQTIATNSSTGPIAFSIGDNETPAGSLTLTAASSSPTLIPTNNIVFGGSGSSRTVTLTPAPAKSGDAIVTITVSDGSMTASTTFQLSVLVPPPPPSALNIVVNGNGSVTPQLNGQNLVLGKTYTIKAVAATGYEFAGWSGGVTSGNPKLTFMMTSNLVLKANFVPSPYVPVAGVYNGLLYNTNEIQLNSSGSFTIKVTPRGTYSARLRIGTRRYGVSGKLNLQCQDVRPIIQHGVPVMTLGFRLGTNTDEADRVFGYVTCNAWTATLLGDRAVFNPKTDPAPYAGRFTLLIPGQENDSAIPMGSGFGIVRVTTKGQVRLVGALADGTRISQSAMLSKNGDWPLYIPLKRGSGSILSWLAFTNEANSDINGTLSWIQTADARSRHYQNGFTNSYEVIGSTYVPPADGNILNFTTARVQFTGGDLGSGYTNWVTLGAKSKVSNTSSNRLVLHFSLPTGMFRGKVTDPTTDKPMSFSGVVLQNRNAGYGFLLSTNLSSEVVVSQ